MTTLDAEQRLEGVAPTPTGGGDGGVVARRAVIRWAWRLLKREWRQQILVLCLLAGAVFAMAFIGTAAYAGAQSPLYEFGTADLLLRFESSDPALAAKLAAVTTEFGPSELVTGAEVGVAGTLDRVQVRRQEQAGRFTSPMVDVVKGRFPVGDTEVALSRAAGDLFGVGIGGTVTLGQNTRTVVGLVENPGNLRELVALEPPPIVGSPGTLCPGGGDACTVQVFVTGTDANLQALQRNVGEPVPFEWKPAPQRGMAAIAVLALSAILLLLVALIAAAGFIVVAQRRQRQLGMLAAIGATNRHLRLVTTTNGALVGAIAAVVGVALALPCWIVASPRLESVAGRRIDPFDVPWWLLVAAMGLAVVTATAAAWWPARVVANVPVMDALSARPPKPRSTQRSGVVNMVVLAGGVVLLILADKSNALLIVLGTLLVVAGTLLAAPLAIRVMAGFAGRFPVGMRLALRDLSRYQARSSAALAAIILALGIPVVTVVLVSAAEKGPNEGNLSSGQILIHISDWDRANIPVRTPTQLAQLNQSINDLTQSLGPRATAVALDMAAPPGVQVDSRNLAETYRPAVTTDSGGLVYIATPALLAFYGLSPASVTGEVLVGDPVSAVRLDSVRIEGDHDAFTETTVTGVQRVGLPSYTRLPRILIAPSVVQANGWEQIRARWLVDAGRPLTATDLATVRRAAGAAGLTMETRDPQRLLGPVRNGAAAIGGILALGILAMTVGLIRGETAGDLRVLAATGASSNVRRSVTATTAGALAFAGALLGVFGAYITLAVGYVKDPAILLHSLPYIHLLLIVLGAPLMAMVVSWLLTRRDMQFVGRPVHD